MDNAIFPNKFKAALAAHQVQIGCWCALANPISTEVLGLAGFDWLVLDAEHAPNDVTTLIPQLMALKGSSSAQVVRVPTNEPIIIKRMLDIGFYNFLVPFVETAEQAAQAVSSTRYPPEGIRGVSVSHRGNMFGTVADYFAQSNKNISILVQIESQTGVDNVEAIAATDGVDGLFVGPSDLAAALGLPPILRCSTLSNISLPARRSTVSQAAFWRQWKLMRAAIWNGGRLSSPSAAIWASSAQQRRNLLMRLKNNHQDEEREHYDNQSGFYRSWHYG